MSGLPLLVELRGVPALVVGGGAVAERKVTALLECGATVRVVAPQFTPALRALSASGRVDLAERPYSAEDVRDAVLVFAATNDRAVNECVTADARAARRLVTVADAPERGSFTSMATHRDGDLVIGVSAGGVPRAAARLRDAVASRFDARYASAVSALATLRRRLLDGGSRERWDAASADLLGDDFCASVESGEIHERVLRWR